MGLIIWFLRLFTPITSKEIIFKILSSSSFQGRGSSYIIIILTYSWFVFIQSYIWRKKESGFWSDTCPFPREVDYMVADTIESLRPKLTIYSSAEEANKAVEEIEKEFQEKLCKLLRFLCIQHYYGRSDGSIFHCILGLIRTKDIWALLVSTYNFRWIKIVLMKWTTVLYDINYEWRFSNQNGVTIRQFVIGQMLFH